VIIPAQGEELPLCSLSKGQLWPETATWLTLTWKDQPRPHNHRHQWLDHLTCKQPAAMESWHFSLFKWTQTICISALCPTWAKYKCTRTRGHHRTVLWTPCPVVCVCIYFLFIMQFKGILNAKKKKKKICVMHYKKLYTVNRILISLWGSWSSPFYICNNAKGFCWYYN